VNNMKKIFVAAVLVIAPMLIATPAKAAPLFSGTSTFNLANNTGPGTELVTVDWNVYAPSTANPFTTTSPNYLYAYTLSNSTGLAGGTFGEYVLHTTTGAPYLLTGAGAGSSPELIATFTFGSGNISSGTAWWESATAPTLVDWKVGGASGNALMAAPTSLGAPLASGVPGVPEPETWALLLAMMGFTMVWMRRKQDDDAPLETTIAA